MDAERPSTTPEPEMERDRRQSLVVEEFFYFFLRLRKNEVRRVAQVLAARYPHDEPARNAHRLIESKSTLSLLGGALLNAPFLIPGLGQTLRLTGVVGAGSMLTRMHLYLILEIAHLFGEDIDDSARVPEMVAVVAATGLGAAAPSLLAAYGMKPILMIPTGALSMTAVTRLIGASAVRFYAARADAREHPPAVEPDETLGAEMPA
jgi:hypothetical protein